MPVKSVYVLFHVPQSKRASEVTIEKREGRDSDVGTLQWRKWQVHGP